MTYAQWHWRVFNVIARILGIWALVIGAFSLVVTLLLITRRGIDAAHIWMGIGISGFSLIIGTLFVTVRPFRPDLHRESGDTQRHDRASWWTGELG